MDNNYCCVPQCFSHGINSPRPSFHRFPAVKENNGIRRLQWIAKLRIGKEVSDRMVVCGKHFKPNDFFPVTAGNKLKRLRLKRNAVPSLNLPTSDEHIIKNEDKLGSKKKKNSKRARSNNKTPTTEKMIPEEEKNICSDETNNIECTRSEEEVNNKILPSSAGEQNEEITDTSPCITQKLRIIVPNYSATDINASEHISKNVEEYLQNSTVSLLPVKLKENSKFDYSILKSSPSDSKEILAQKLDTMISVNELLQKKVKFFQNKCKMYETEVNIMKGVIDNLKQINSATFDN